MTLAVLVSLAAGAGSVLRYLVDRLLQARTRGGFPYGTLLVNVTGSLAVGIVAGLARRDAIDARVAMVLSAGLLGGYTTLSTWAWETVALRERGAARAAAVNAVGTLAICLGAAALGLVAAAR